MDYSSWQGELTAAPTLDHIAAQRLAHDEAEVTVLWPAPAEDQELRRSKKRRGDSRDHRRGGGFGGGGGHGGGGSVRLSAAVHYSSMGIKNFV